MFFYKRTDIYMSHLENGLKVTVLTQSAKFFSEHPKDTGSAILTPKRYDEHPVRSSVHMRLMGVPPGGVYVRK